MGLSPDLSRMALIYTLGQFKIGETWTKQPFGGVDTKVPLRLCTLEGHWESNLL